MMRDFIFVLVVLIIAIGCGQSKPDFSAEEAALRNTDSSWSALARQGGDVDKIVSYWSDDAVVLAPGQPAVKGKEALKKMVADSKNIPGFSISWSSSDIEFSPDGKMAYMYSENLMTMNDSSGKQMNMPGRAYTIWRKEADGNWKCVVDIWNNPPAQ